MGGLRVAVGKPEHVAGERVVEEGGGFRPAHEDELSGRFRISYAAQLAHEGTAVAQCRKIDLGAQLFTAAEPNIGEGRAALQHRSDRFGQEVDLGFAKAKLADPDRAEAQASRVERAAVAGNRVAVQHNACYV